MLHLINARRVARDLHTIDQGHLSLRVGDSSRRSICAFTVMMMMMMVMMMMMMMMVMMIVAFVVVILIICSSSSIRDNRR